MLLFWKIHYLDRSDRQFKDRDFFLNTAALPPAQGLAVEMLMESMKPIITPEIRQFRSFFVERSMDEINEARLKEGGRVWSFMIPDYFEDETGAELLAYEMGPILTGNPNSLLIPPGSKQHDVDLMLATPEPVPDSSVSLSEEQIELLAYFVRDLEELTDSTFANEGAGTITSSPKGLRHKTAVSDDEIRSHVMIFRRLYMAGEPANFRKATVLFREIMNGHAVGEWVHGVAQSYEDQLSSDPDSGGFNQGLLISFNAKRLIDVFLYTQYVHQPNQQRQKQFSTCLDQVGSDYEYLTWLFLTTLWRLGMDIQNAGRMIRWWFNRYCIAHDVTPTYLDSLRKKHAGLGVEEKEDERRRRLYQEKRAELEIELWKRAGRPEGGPRIFRRDAEDQLHRALLDVHGGEEHEMNQA